MFFFSAKKAQDVRRAMVRDSNTLALRGLEEPFFQLLCCVCCVSFCFWWEKGFGLHTHVLLRVQYSCVVVLIFWLQGEIVFGVLCTYLMYNIVVLLCQFFGCSGK